MRTVTNKLVEKFREYLYEEEKSNATVSKYICDIKKLKEYANGHELDKKQLAATRKEFILPDL